jgi:hypothetical protein
MDVVVKVEELSLAHGQLDINLVEPKVPQQLHVQQSEAHALSVEFA